LTLKSLTVLTIIMKMSRNVMIYILHLVNHQSRQMKANEINLDLGF